MKVLNLTNPLHDFTISVYCIVYPHASYTTKPLLYEITHWFILGLCHTWNNGVASFVQLKMLMPSNYRVKKNSVLANNSNYGQILCLKKETNLSIIEHSNARISALFPLMQFGGYFGIDAQTCPLSVASAQTVWDLWYFALSYNISYWVHAVQMQAESTAKWYFPARKCLSLHFDKYITPLLLDFRFGSLTVGMWNRKKDSNLTRWCVWVSRSGANEASFHCPD